MCSNEHYLDTATNSCSPCSLKVTACLRCYEVTPVTTPATYKCAECRQGFYEDSNNVCQTCPSNCYACQSQTNCTTCVSGYYPSSSTGLCVRCTISNCIACDSTSATCLQCRS